MSSDPSGNFKPPLDLVEKIRAGRCIAFVGAGFAQPSIPGWVELLKLLAERLEASDAKEQLKDWLEKSRLRSQDLEGIGAMLREELRESFKPTLVEIIKEREIVDQTERRVELLNKIPFRAVLTTNFDQRVLTGGKLPSPEVYNSILNSSRRQWRDHADWETGESNPAPILNLHGHLGDDCSEKDLVFTTRSYRHLVHEKPAYRAFLRALFATNTVLFMGFSFTDAYINELRSETSAMLGTAAERKDYAILDNVPPLVREHLDRHHELGVLGFEAKDGDFSGFDSWLEALCEKTSPESSVRNLVKGRRIIWLDPNEENNAHGLKVLRGESEPSMIKQVHGVEEALEQLQTGERIDLIISHFGYQDGAPSTAERLLAEMPIDDRRAPVLIFASGHHKAENRETVLRLGALDYASEWPELFDKIGLAIPKGDHRI